MASSGPSSTLASIQHRLQKTYIEDLHLDARILRADDGWKFKLSEDLWTRFRGQHERLGVVRSLALGLTEMCATSGTGMVLYLIYRPTKEEDTETPATYHALPNLIYMRHSWTPSAKEDWFGSPHQERLDALNARSPETRQYLPTWRDQGFFFMTLGYMKKIGDVVHIRPSQLALGTICYFGQELFFGNSYRMVKKMTLISQYGAQNGERRLKHYEGPRMLLRQYQVFNAEHIVKRLAYYANDRAHAIYFYERVYDGLDGWTKYWKRDVQHHRNSASQAESFIVQDLSERDSSWSREQRLACDLWVGIGRQALHAPSRFMLDRHVFAGMAREEWRTLMKLWALQRMVRLSQDGSVRKPPGWMPYMSVMSLR